MTTVCVLLAPGFEEIEAVTVIDVLRRAGFSVTTAALETSPVCGSHEISIQAESTLSSVIDQQWDCLVLPGGIPGATHLRDSPIVLDFLRKQVREGRKIGAICAAPIALSAAGLLSDLAATSYPSFADETAAREYREEDVVVDGDIITSRGPATALAFALTLVEELKGVDAANHLRKALLVSR